MADAERQRLNEADSGRVDWRRWGPYLSERQWGTVREDYGGGQDTGIFDDNRYFDIVVEYAKAGPEDVLLRITAHNRGPDDAELHVLPTLWFRHTWSWAGDEPQPVLRTVADHEGRPAIRAEHRD